MFLKQIKYINNIENQIYDEYINKDLKLQLLGTQEGSYQDC